MDSSSLRYSELWAVEAQFPLCLNNPTIPQGLKTAGRARCYWWNPSAALHKAKWWISCRIHLRGTVRSKMETGLETSSNMNPKSIQDIRSKVCQGGRGRHRPVVHDTKNVASVQVTHFSLRKISSGSVQYISHLRYTQHPLVCHLHLSPYLL